MTDFKSLPPEMRAFALVGYYMANWAFLEHKLNENIGKALKLTFEQRVIVTNNLQFRAKLKILRTLLNVAITNDDAKKKNDKFTERLGNMSDDRNVIAHNLFSHDKEKNGVQFLVAKAHGKLAFPDITWSIDDFDLKVKELHQAAKELATFETIFTRSDLVKALYSQTAKPTPKPFGLGAKHQEDPQPQRDQDHQESTGDTNPQTPQEPEEK